MATGLHCGLVLLCALPLGCAGGDGKQGPPGPSGDAGPQGESGETGAPGAQGATGAQGETGARGTTGAPGEAGAAGATGALGPRGATGAQGEPGPQGEAGAPGPRGEPGTAAGDGGAPSSLPGSITGISPLLAYRDRTTTIALSASGTDFVNPTVDFGSGVIVDNVVVASPTGLVVTITVGGDAPDGVRDVTVTDGDEQYVYAGAFEVRPPATLSPQVGEFAQGSVVFGQIQLDDLSHRFTAYTTVQTPVGVSASFGSPSPFAVDTTLYIDVTALGAYELFATTPGLPETTTRVPFTVAPNPALTADLGVSKSGTIARPYQTRLFAVNTTPGSLLVAKATVVSGAAPAVYMLTDGSWQDHTEPTRSVVPTLSQAVRYASSDTYYFAVMDVSGESDYGFNLLVEELVTIDHEPTNDNCLTPTDLGSLPAAIDNLVLATQYEAASIPFDEDWFSVTVGAGAVGQSFQISTTSTEAGEADTIIEVLYGDCFGIYDSLGASDDLEVDDTLTTGPIPSAGTYLIKVARSTYSHQTDVTASGQLYSLAVDLVP